MKCIEIRELLSLYIDNMLDDDQVQEVEIHLSSCDACRKEYNELKEMLELLGHTEPIPVPDEFSFRMRKALKEEKQKMIDDGLIAVPPRKKNRWRIITSVAAVFAVGILSYGFYDNVLDSIPYFNNGADQAEQIMEAEDTDTKIAAMEEADPDSYSGSAEDSASSSDGSVVMKDESNDQPLMMADGDLRQESAGSGSADTYGTVAGSVPEAENQLSDAGKQKIDAANQPADAANQPADAGNQSADTAVQQESAAETSGLCDDFAFKSSVVSTKDELSRSLTGSGLERNSAAVQYYNKQIEEKLSGFDYQILETTYSQTGEWHFRIFIFRGKDGNTYNEEIRIIGKDGEIEISCSNDFMGL